MNRKIEKKGCFSCHFLRDNKCKMEANVSNFFSFPFEEIACSDYQLKYNNLLTKKRNG